MTIKIYKEEGCLLAEIEEHDIVVQSWKGMSELLHRLDKVLLGEKILNGLKIE